MRWYAFGEYDHWLTNTVRCTDVIDAWGAIHVNVRHFCYVWDDDELVAIIDLMPWYRTMYGINDEHRGVKAFIASQLKVLCDET